MKIMKIMKINPRDLFGQNIAAIAIAKMKRAFFAAVSAMVTATLAAVLAVTPAMVSADHITHNHIEPHSLTFTNGSVSGDATINWTRKGDAADVPAFASAALLYILQIRVMGTEWGTTANASSIPAGVTVTPVGDTIRQRSGADAYNHNTTSLNVSGLSAGKTYEMRLGTHNLRTTFFGFVDAVSLTVPHTVESFIDLQVSAERGEPNLQLTWNPPGIGSAQFGSVVQVKLPNVNWIRVDFRAYINLHEAQQVPPGANFGNIRDVTVDGVAKKRVSITGLAVNTVYDVRLAVVGTVATGLPRVSPAAGFSEQQARTNNTVATLSALSVTTGGTAKTLMPPFSPQTTEYTVFYARAVGGSADYAIAATTTDSNADALITPASSGNASLDFAGADRRFIRVLAENGLQSATYTVNLVVPPESFDIVQITDGVHAAEIPFTPAASTSQLFYTAGSNAAKTGIPRFIDSVKLNLDWTNGGVSTIGLRGKTPINFQPRAPLLIPDLVVGDNPIEVGFAAGGKIPMRYTINIERLGHGSTAPGVVALAPPSDIDRTTFTINWTAATDAEAYFVRWRTAAQLGAPAGPWQDAAGNDAECGTSNEDDCGVLLLGAAHTSHTVSSNLTPGTKYEYAVRAANSHSHGVWSASGTPVTVASTVADLASLRIEHSGETSAIALIPPAFDADVLTYSATLPNAASVDVSAAVAQGNASMKIGISGAEAVVANSVTDHSVAVTQGMQTLNVIVTAEDGTTSKTYALILEVIPPLPPQDFLLPEITAQPGAPNLRVQWTEPSVDGSVIVVQMKPTSPPSSFTDITSAATADAVRALQQIPDGATLTPIAGGVGANITGLALNTEYDVRLIVFGQVSASQTIAIATTPTVIAEQTARTNNNVSTLSGISVSGGGVGASIPPFHTDIREYNYIVTRGAGGNIRITPTPTDPNADAAVVNFTINTSTAGADSRVISVAAENGINTTDYKVNIVSPPSAFNIASITATDGGLVIPHQPTAARNVFSYSAGTDSTMTSVPNTIAQVNVNATWGNFAGNTQIIRTRGGTNVALSSGVARTIDLVAGEQNHIEIGFAYTQTATPKDFALYTISIFRRNPATTAPGTVALSPPVEITQSGFKVNWAVVADASEYYIRWRRAESTADAGDHGLWQNAAGNDNDCNDGDAGTDDSCGELISGGATTEYAIAGLTPNTRYQYSVRARNDFAAGAWSDSATAQLTLRSDNANLASLSLEHGDDNSALVLNPEIFAEDTLTYSVAVPNAVTVDVTAAAAYPTANLKIGINGAETAAGNTATAFPVGVNDGLQTLNIIVTAEDGSTTKTYALIVDVEPPQTPQEFLAPQVVAQTGAPNLRVLWTLPTADDDAYAIVVQVKPTTPPASFTDISGANTIAAAANLAQLPPGATFTAITTPLSGDDAGKTGGDISGLSANTEYDVRLVVIGMISAKAAVATTATATASQSVRTLNNDATLSSLTVTGAGVGAPNPAFRPEITEYNYVVARTGAENVNISATATDANAVVSDVAQFSFATNQAGADSRIVTVTAEDGVSTTDYKVNIVAPPSGFSIHAITVPGGGVSISHQPAASNGVFSYSAGSDAEMRSVPNSVSRVNVEVRWTVHAGNVRFIRLRGGANVALVSGTAQSIDLAAGANHIEIGFAYSHQATPRDPALYTITIIRDLPQPPAAVTLSAESDIAADAFTANWSQEMHAEMYFIRWRVAAQNGNPAGLWQNAAGDDAECNDTDAANDAACGEMVNGGATVSYAITGLASNTQYDYSVRAANSHFQSDWSESANPVMTPASSNANLANLSLNHATDGGEIALNPAVFAIDTLTYSATIHNATTLNVTAAVADATASMQIGIAGDEQTTAGSVAAYPVEIALGNSTLNLIITAEDGVTSQTYVLNLDVTPPLPPQDYLLPQITAHAGIPNLRVLWTKPDTADADFGIAVQSREANSGVNWSTAAIAAIADIAAAEQAPPGANIETLPSPPSGMAGVSIVGLRANTQYDIRLAVIGQITTSVNYAAATAVVFTPAQQMTTFSDVATLSGIDTPADASSALIPDFDANRADYFILYARTDDSTDRTTNLSATATDAAATIAGLGDIAFDDGDTGAVTHPIVVTAQDGVTTATYSLGLAVPPDTFDITEIAAGGTTFAFTPAASNQTLFYDAGMVENTVTSLAITADWTNGGVAGIGLRGQTSQMISANSAATVSGLQIGANDIEIKFQDGKDPLPYRISVFRSPINSAPDAPVLASPTEITADGFTVNWNAVANTENYFVRWRVAAQNGNSAGLWQNATGDADECNDTDTANDAACGQMVSGGSSVSYAIAGLQSNTQYDYSVRAVNSIDAGTWTESAAAVATAASADSTLRVLHADIGDDMNLINFADGTTSYAIGALANEITQLDMTASVQHAGASLTEVTLDGVAIVPTPQSAIPFLSDISGVATDGVTGGKIIIRVAAEDASSTDYIITFTRLPSAVSGLDSLVAIAGGDGENLIAFAAETTSYSLGELAFKVGQINITANVTHSAATIMSATLDGMAITPAAEAGVEFSADITNVTADAATMSVITIVIAAEDASTTTYTLTFTRTAASTDSSLGTLTANAGGDINLIAFATATTEYALGEILALPAELNITANPSDAVALIKSVTLNDAKIDPTPAAGAEFSIDISGIPADSTTTGRIKIIATTDDESSTIYTLTFTRGINALDADADEDPDATDGILIARYLLGLRGADLTERIITAATDAEITAATTAIESRLTAETTAMSLNVNNDTETNAADGILIARYLLGVIDGAGLSDGQTSPNTNAAAVVNKIDALRAAVVAP